MGHNRTSCKNPKDVPEPKPKKKIGRPKLDLDLANLIGCRRGDRGGRGNRGGGRGSGRRGNRCGGRGSGGRGKRGGVMGCGGRVNKNFGEGTSKFPNIESENEVTPTVDNEAFGFHSQITVDIGSEGQPPGVEVMDQEGMGEEDMDQHDMGEDGMDQHDMGVEVMD
ncbi:ATP-dependent RNA helicase DBP2-like [Lactuca sativa]|uniref:Uncharacterized protein n=1 Tax=Lactuca sativa TaxID=4236 RepID=A0A9R1UXU3_LACSA|nr:ATP-dependent RNA helicase DBP2-like [Lactuca sativa]KAJ0195811.1 hypothetical protein LSAT_V11C700366340 [Lactuca sativa]